MENKPPERVVRARLNPHNRYPTVRTNASRGENARENVAELGGARIGDGPARETIATQTVVSHFSGSTPENGLSKLMTSPAPSASTDSSADGDADNRGETTGSPESNSDRTHGPGELAQREIRYRHSKNFVPLLRLLSSSLLVSTYSAGKLVVVGTSEAGLELSFLNFQKAMGVAVGGEWIAVGAGGQVWFLSNNASLPPPIVSRIRP